MCYVLRGVLRSKYVFHDFDSLFTAKKECKKYNDNVGNTNNNYLNDFDGLKRISLRTRM